MVKEDTNFIYFSFIHSWTDWGPLMQIGIGVYVENALLIYFYFLILEIPFKFHYLKYQNSTESFSDDIMSLFDGN